MSSGSVTSPPRTGRMKRVGMVSVNRTPTQARKERRRRFGHSSHLLRGSEGPSVPTGQAIGQTPFWMEPEGIWRLSESREADTRRGLQWPTTSSSSGEEMDDQAGARWIAASPSPYGSHPAGGPVLRAPGAQPALIHKSSGGWVPPRVTGMITRGGGDHQQNRTSQKVRGMKTCPGSRKLPTMVAVRKRQKWKSKRNAKAMKKTY